MLTFCSNWYNLKDGQLVAVAFLNTRGRPSSIRCDIKAHLHLFRFKNMSQVHISPSVYDKIKWPQSKLDWKVLVRPLLVPKTCVSVGNIASDNWSLLANQKRSLTVHFLRVTSWPTLRPPWVTVLKSFLDSQMVSFWPRNVLWPCKPRSFQNFEITEGLRYFCKEFILTKLQIFQVFPYMTNVYITDEYSFIACETFLWQMGLSWTMNCSWVFKQFLSLCSLKKIQ